MEDQASAGNRSGLVGRTPREKQEPGRRHDKRQMARDVAAAQAATPRTAKSRELFTDRAEDAGVRRR